MYKHLMTFSDGGARGNPGPAAIAFVIQSETGQTLATGSSYVGVCTNNQAEYRALLEALQATKAFKTETLTCHLDSELVVKQLTGEYKVKNKELKHLWQTVQEFRKNFRDIKFVNVPRTHSIIQEMDKLVNLTLNKETVW
jgi:ribonuclease HI